MPDYKEVFIEAFSKYFDLVYGERLDTSKLLKHTTRKWATCSWKSSYVLGVVQESIGMDIQLVNQINLIDRSRITLNTWDEILDDYEDMESFNIYNQFVESDAILAADAPYKVKSRFAYLSAYIIHHCLNIIDDNYTKTFNNRLHFSDLEKLLDHDRINEVADNTEGLYELIKPIYHDEFKDESLNFRNREHHRDGPTIFTGTSAQVKEVIEDDGNKKYQVYIKEPIPLKKLVNSLNNEIKKCRKAYFEFEKFVADSFKIFEEYKAG